MELFKGLDYSKLLPSSSQVIDEKIDKLEIRLTSLTQQIVVESEMINGGPEWSRTTDTAIFSMRVWGSV